MQEEISEIETPEGFELSPQQRRVWRFQQEARAGNPYRAQCAIGIEGRLDSGALKDAVAQTLRRHEILRTSFYLPDEDDFPLQVINERAEPLWEEISLEALEPEQQAVEVAARFRQEATRAFNFGRASLLRVSLVSLNSQNHILLLSLPALCADGVTLNNLFAEIVRHYAAYFHEGEESEEPIRYVQFSEWQHELLQEEDAAQAKEFWRKRSPHEAAEQSLPFENRTAEQAAFKPDNLTRALDASLTERARNAARHYEADLPSLLLTCWQVLLGRLTGSARLVNAYLSDGRKFAEFDAAFGLFARALPIVASTDERHAFSVALKQAQRSIDEALDRQEYFTWPEVAHARGDGADAVRELFPAISFEFETQPAEEVAAGVKFAVVNRYVCFERFKLKLACSQRGASLFIELHYDTALFEAGEMERLADAFQTLLGSAVANPEAPLWQLEILSTAEREHLLYALNDTRADFDLDLCMHELFEHQVEHTPEGIAVIFEEQQYTYAGLNARANRLAHHLAGLGVGAESPVGIFMERSGEIITAILAVLKAGGAYLPLDPQSPQDRLAFMLEDARASVLLTQHSLLERLPAYAGTTIYLDGDLEAIGRESDNNLNRRTAARNLAYVIYTSGSTGQPKGVAVEHRQLVNYVLGITQRLDFPVDAHSATVSTFAADLGHTTIFPSLCGGGTLHIISQQRTSDAEALAQYCANHPIDCLKVVPSHLAALLVSSRRAFIIPRQRLILGGESSSLKWVAEVQKLNPSCRIFNHYGPTETTVGVLTHAFSAKQANGDETTLPLGRPIPNAQVYILDEQMRPLPKGVAGGLFIGGAGLSRGYLNRPELTAERFVPHPFSLAPGARLYHSGDRARHLPDGSIEFLGRIDNQVKVRGFRIELGEIEAALSTHVAVREVAVVAHEDGTGDKRLVAYLVAAQGASVSGDELRHYLRERLPDFMIPASFMLLAEMPLTPNGKIDRRALLPLEEAQRSASGSYIAPRTPVEELLAGIWAEVLRVERVGTDDNFFDVGGHSLLMTQVVSRVRETFKVELPVRALFSAFTVAALAESIEAQMSAGEGLHAPPLVEASRDGELELSFAQQRLWFLNQLEPDNPFYNRPAALKMNGSLDVEALEHSLNEVVRRHEVLRTRFVNLEGRPVQVIEPSFTIALPVEDISGLEAGERDHLMWHSIAEDAQRIFDLSRDMLLRARLLRLDEQEHVLLLTLHHIISDGWSIGVLVREVAALYEARLKGQPSPLSPLPIQYADYAQWQRRWLQGRALETQLDFWRHQLAGAPALMELPTDRPRPVVQSYRGATHTFLLNAALSESLRAFSRREGATLFMTLLAAFQTLLHRYTGQESIIVGTPVANRNYLATEALIGFFVNTLVLRGDVYAEQRFRHLLQQVRERALGAYAYQDLPFEKLVEELQPERALSRNPLFQVMFVLQNTPQTALELPGLKLSMLEGESATAKFDLNLSIIDDSSSLRATLEYSTDLFDATTIERLADHFQTLLHGIVENADRPIAELPLLTQAERRQLLVEWNDTLEDYGNDKRLNEHFEAQAGRTPDALAVVFEEQRLSYRELDERANCLAGYLRRLGIDTEMPVGICVERSIEMLVAVLGVMKAGGSYLPLDPDYPKDRLAFMLEHTGVEVLLTQQRLEGSLPAHHARAVRLDADWHEIAREPAQKPAGRATVDNLAYIIYTSGSTGKPKGVMVTHRAIANRLLWMQDWVGFAPSDIFLQKTSLSFDASIWEIFVPLMIGASLVLARPGGHSDNAYLVEIIVEQEVSVLQLVPSMLRVFLEHERVAECRSLRHMFCGGEALPVELQEKFDRLLGTQLLNLYGPTEASIDATAWKCERVDSGRGKFVSIGRPIGNMQVYILDAALNPVPVGVLGELHIGGVGLARGYFNRPDLTAGKFIPNPHGSEPGTRLYRTGDLVRHLPDGSIDYVGRIDEQVKVRGYRIEPGEIEAALREHEAVSAAVVIVREGTDGDKRLVAYLINSQDTSPASSELKDFLRERLPEYMIPSAIISLSHFPLTPNGKLDRLALPAPVASLSLPLSFMPPHSPLQELLANIWSALLDVSPISLSDNFFDLGGHSLLATRLISRLKHSFHLELPLRSIFEHPTLEDFARFLQPALLLDHHRTSPPLLPVGRDADLPLSFAQQRLWFLDQLQPASALYNIPLALRLTGALDLRALHTGIKRVVARHEALRTNFRVTEGVPVQVIAPPAAIEMPVIDLSGVEAAAQREAEARRLMKAEAERPFDLAGERLVRSQVVKLSTGEHVWLLTLHHIVSDAWSIGILLREVAALYAEETGRGGEATELEELRVQYGDYAVWQREWLKGEVLAEQLEYWREQLAGAPAVLEIPADRARPAEASHRGAQVEFRVGRELTKGLRELSRREGVTLFMTLLAAFQLLLARYSGQSDIVVGADVANRNQPEIEPLIGFFINMLVLRMQFSSRQTFRQLLAQERETCLGAYAHQDMPFDKLVEELQVERSPSYSPIFQVVFVLQNAPLGALELPGLQLQLVEMQDERAKFDLILSIREVEERLDCTLGYDAALFDEQTIQRMSGHLKTLLEGIVSNPLETVANLPLLDEAERRQLLVEWNQTRTDYPQCATIQQLFEAQAEATPDAIALLFAGEEITYGELNRRANQVAHYLHSLGVAAEVTVGLCLPRSIEMVTALLGILKAGGAYVPLDPLYPMERLAFIIDDAGVTVLLTQESLLDALPAHWSNVVCIDADRDTICGHSEQDPPGGVNAENLAYIIYTSGSTGQPKGVSVTHRNVIRLVKETNYAAFDAGQVWLQLAPISFDASTLEIWGALLNGARLALAPSHALTLEELGHTLRRYGVSTLWLTAGLFQLMVDERLEDLRGLRQLLAGGDVLSPPHVVRALEALEGGSVINGYGPTETTTFACCYPMSGVEQLDAGVPIGRPIANAEAYLLDGNLHPVPLGVTGELYIGGDGVARGYHRRADLTAERFIPHPSTTQPGARLYRTGDLARYRPDGQIHFFGRIDSQVKVRGFRVELGEVEAALLKHGAVREAVVVVREESASEKRLVAYVVADDTEQSLSSQLQSFLQERLPEYMIPSFFISLSHFPLTPNGKLDRLALPAPVASLSLPLSFMPPHSPLQELLANIWSALLDVSPISLSDNFFDLGGHSLLATRLISRLKHSFHVELPLRSIFEHPTLEAFARFLQPALLLDHHRISPPLLPVSREADLPLSFAQQRLWFLDQLQPASALYNIPLALRLSGALDLRALHTGIERVVARHEALRTNFQVTEGVPVQVIAPHSSIKMPVIDLSAMASPPQQAAEARRLMKAEAERPFDLAQERLVRNCLLRLAASEHVWLLTLHHIVSDAWSIGILLREVAALYGAETGRGEAAGLEELRVQYGDYAVWQREWLRGEVLAEQLGYWREQLAGAPAVLEIPADRARPAMQSFESGLQTLVLPPDLSDALRALSRREGVTLFMTLLSAFHVLLYRYSGQESINVGTPIANRNHPEIEPLIGFFVNTLVIRANLSGHPSFIELLSRTREAALGAYMHQDVPFERLVEELNTERSLSHSPIFQVMFALQNTSIAKLELPGLQSVLLEQADTEQVGKFELSLIFTEDDNDIKGSFVYHTDLFDPATIERMSTHLRVLLESVVAAPEQNIDDLSLMTEAELRQLLSDGAPVELERKATCLHQLFEAQVAETPEAIALVSRGVGVSYRELNRRANQVAHYLHSLGVAAEVTVGLCLPRSIEMVTALLGILKAGGAYVPLDPLYPMERLAFIIDDAGIKALVTQQQFVEILPDKTAQVVRLDADAERISQMPSANPSSPVRPEDLAYLIYTSGSTGRPKGVMVEHRQIVNTLNASQQAFNFSASEVMPCMAPYSFDIFLFELLNPLLKGGRSVLLTHEEVLEASVLVRLLEEMTSFHAVPGLMRLILNALKEQPQSHGYRHIRQVFVGGDAVPNELVKEILDAFPAAGVFILYGPTEAAIICAAHAVKRGQDAPYKMLGRALPNMTLRLYDKHGNLVPVGVNGEIHIGGASVSRGYRKREELTREKFVEIEGERFYRSGDIGRRLPDGSIAFIGRDDAQVKVRGFRVEIGEIESALAGHPDVRECVVVALDDAAEGKRLVAYVASGAEHPPTTSDLRGHLQQRLPEHMIPSAFVLLESLPLTANGKIDRQALLTPSSVRPELVSTYVAPHTELELLIASAWREVLGVEGLGVDDNFFDVGGNSLLLVRVQSKLRSLVEQEVSVLDLFKHPTIGSLAGYLSRTETVKPSYEQAQIRTQKQKDFVNRQKQKARKRRTR